MSQHFSEPINVSSSGEDGSSTRTPSQEIRGAQHLEEIEEVVVELFSEENTGGTSRGNSRGNSGKMLKKKVPWSIKEDEALVSAYINGGGDVEKGTDQSRKDLRVTIRGLYEAAREANPTEINERTTKSLQNQWDHINGTVLKWVGVYAECKRNKKSGQTEEDVENDAHESYSKMYHGNRFTLMHAWGIMRQKKNGNLRAWIFLVRVGGALKGQSPMHQPMKVEMIDPRASKKQRGKQKKLQVPVLSTLSLSNQL